MQGRPAFDEQAAQPVGEVNWPIPRQETVGARAWEPGLTHAGVAGWSLQVATANCTCWASAKDLVVNPFAHVLALQETKLDRAADIDEASSWAIKRGWKSLWSPALRTAKGGVSAGLAILAREELALLEPDLPEGMERPGRVQAAVLQAPGHRSCLIVNVYLYTGIGLSVRNLELLQAVGQVISTLRMPSMVVGDFNLGPAAMLESLFPHRAHLSMMVPS